MLKIRNTPFYLLLTLSLVSHLRTSAQGAAPGNKTLEDVQREFCQKYAGSFDNIESWIRENKGKKPELAVPPAVELDCSECGTEHHRNISQNKIDEYIRQLAKPESDYITRLNEIERAQGMAFGMPPDYAQLPPDLVKCARHISQEAIENDKKALMNRIFDDKVRETVYRYENEPRYAWTLINTVCYYIKYYINILGYSHLYGSGPAGITERNDQGYVNLQFADEYALKLYEKNYSYYKKQLYEQYHYNIYPNLMPIARDYLLNGGHDEKLENNLLEYINESISFMHFKLKIHFEETGPAWHYTLKGETVLRCRLVPDTAFYSWCYAFEPADGKGLKMKMDNIAITPPGATADYIGPNEADNPFIIRVNLCDGSPILHLIFTRFGISGQSVTHVEGKDVTGPAPMQPLGYFVPDIATANKKLEEQKELANDFKSHMSVYETAMKEWASHRNDANFKNTPQGKRDYALILQFQHQTGVQTPFLNGYGGQNTTKPAQSMAGPQKTYSSDATGNNKLFTFDLPLHFSKQAINYDNTADFGNKIHYHVTITMEETPDKRDNIKSP